jgi:transcriptional regulator with XRE-family HTH domain
MAEKSFRSQLRERRPDLAREIATSEVKRKLALALRALRKEKGMTQQDVERKSTLSQPMISRLEAPTGSLPAWDTVMRYVAACDGHMLVGFSAHAFDEHAFVKSRKNTSDEMIAAVAV